MRKLNTIMFLSLIIVSLLALQTSFPQVTQEWVARYSGQGDSADNVRSMAADRSGNVYVTGSSMGNGTSYDYVTIKYNAAGDSEWVARYNGPGNSNDVAISIDIDNYGNVYVTGGSSNSNMDMDFLSIKYNSSGTQLWVSRYGGLNSSDFAESVKADDSGNVFVTGSSGIGPATDIVTIKYSSNGDSLWVRRFNGASNLYDGAALIELDGLGNIYVSGVSTGSSTGQDYAVIKYNNAGVQQWIKSYNGPANGNDRVKSIAADNTGNIYVTGSSAVTSSKYDYYTIKYGSEGQLLWTARHIGRANFHDEANSIAVDNLRNVFVTGYVNDSTGSWDYGTIKYDSAGTEQWVAIYDGPGNYSDDAAYSIALDDSGNAYVTGFSEQSLNIPSFVTLKYNSSGIQQWIQKYSGPGINNIGIAVAVDSSGNVYVTGNSSGIDSNYDYATIKYSQTTSVKQTSAEIPARFSLSQNYPNPFNPKTIINYQITMINNVSLKVYNILGEEVSVLVNERQAPGSYQAEFDGSNLTSGVYFYRLEAGDFKDVKRMMLVK